MTADKVSEPGGQQMSEIKRYNPKLCGPSGSKSPDVAAMTVDAVGLYIRYTDHLAAVEAAVMAEREACAAVCMTKRETIHTLGQMAKTERDRFGWRTALLCVNSAAEAIRARNTKPAKDTP